MRGLDERAVLRLILVKQGGEIWIGMGLEGGCCENYYKTLSFETTLRKRARFYRCKLLECY